MLAHCALFSSSTIHLSFVYIDTIIGLCMRALALTHRELRVLRGILYALLSWVQRIRWSMDENRPAIQPKQNCHMEKKTMKSHTRARVDMCVCESMVQITLKILTITLVKSAFSITKSQHHSPFSSMSHLFYKNKGVNITETKLFSMTHGYMYVVDTRILHNIMEKISYLRSSHPTKLSIFH